MSDLIRDRRYNDRDVRDNPDLHAVAVRYLEQYTGEFDFLVDMRIRALDEDYGLTVGMVRGVLNCMRNDPRVRDLPEPGPQDTEEASNVVSITGRGHWVQRGKAVTPASKERPPCPQAGTEHYIHRYPDPDDPSSSWHCLGWHALTRRSTDTEARFHADYLRGANSNVIHRSSHTGWVTWWPHRHHEEGQATPDWWHVKPTCYTPALKQPTLLDAAGVRAAEPYDRPSSTQGGRYTEVTLCSRCFPGGDTTVHTREGHDRRRPDPGLAVRQEAGAPPGRPS